MKFSIFTPTHDTKYLVEAQRSLLAQSVRDWEWVVVINNGATLPPEMQDTRIRVLHAPTGTEGVGALKKFACGECKGELLVELDHDDKLMPNALEKVAKAADDGADFIYSDAANFRADGTYELYDKVWGWEHYSYRVGDEVHQANRSFEPDASSLREIFYAPNHVRVWKADVYREIGGHDVTLPICDDHDLVMRTYLAKARFHHIPEALYLYRLQENGTNTWLQRNAEIQTKQAELRDRYTHALVNEWCRRNEYLKLDLGGGINCPEGFTAADLKTGVDLRQPWPFADNSIGCIRAYDFLEHIPHCRDSACTHEAPFCSVGLMNEAYRVLVPGGWMLTATPSTDGRGAFQDPTHCSYWNTNSHWYWTRRQQQQYVPGIKARFQMAHVRNEFPSPWHQLHNIVYAYADLVALKGQRQPGLVEI